MRDRHARAREIMTAIGAVLLQDWDPIGVEENPDTQKEYDGYVGGIYQLLVSGATAVQLAEHLRKVEAEKMGLGQASAKGLLPVAEKLLALDVSLRGGSVA